MVRFGRHICRLTFAKFRYLANGNSSNTGLRDQVSSVVHYTGQVLLAPQHTQRTHLVGSVSVGTCRILQGHIGFIIGYVELSLDIRT